MNRNDATTRRMSNGPNLGAANTFWAIVSLTAVVGMLVVNLFRYELLGIEPGYAPHNFGFGVLIILPLMIITFGLSSWTLGWAIVNWNRLSRWHRFASAIPSILVISHTTYVFGRLLL